MDIERGDWDEDFDGIDEEEQGFCEAGDHAEDFDAIHGHSMLHDPG